MIAAIQYDSDGRKIGETVETAEDFDKKPEHRFIENQLTWDEGINQQRALRWARWGKKW